MHGGRWGAPPDVALRCNVLLHHFDDTTCAGILRTAAGAVAPWGKLAVLEFLHDTEIRNPMGAMLATLMLALPGMPASYVIADKG